MGLKCNQSPSTLPLSFVRLALRSNRQICRTLLYYAPWKEEFMKQKLKTHTAMAKRVKITGSGKIMRRKVALSHLRRNKSPHSVRSMDKEFPLATSDKRRIKRLLPYSF